MIYFGFILLTLILGAVLIKHSKKEQPKKIFDVYAQKGKWYYLKYIIISLLIIIKRFKYYIYGKDNIEKIHDLEKLQMLSNHNLAFDAVYVQTASQNGIYYCAGMERRHGGKIVGLVYIVHPDYGVLESEELPNTIMDATVLSLYNQDSFSGGGMTFMPVVPMKKWKIGFNGTMKFQNNPQKRVHVNFEADWTSEYDWFFLEIDLPISTLARSLATEEWSEQWFQNLKNVHQRHYEQIGHVNGTLEIDGEAYPIVNWDSFRDHSFGFKRDWSLMHRFIYTTLILSDKTTIVLGLISQPITMSHLEMGFVNHPDGRIHPVEKIDLLLYEHAENGVLPKELSFSFRAAGVSYDVQMEFIYEATHYKGSNEDIVVTARFVKCAVNGIPGRGFSDWQYKNCIFK
ncbi:unnamed protein product [Diabrotica balteata]|uniref:Uncharacterized protein n=1 Tax=Diabrotica balteata TaxID=107213 RepID=A0A9N9XFA4_DIABA|nr:unnamed protein product [Diabrotica balteata]